MKITKMKTNRITNPLGFTLNTPSLSWQVEGVEGKKQVEGKLELALDEDFKKIIYRIDDNEKINSITTRLDITLEEEKRYFWRLELTTDLGEKIKSPTAWFETGRKELVGDFITGEEEIDSNFLYEKSFELNKLPNRARLYASALGLYQLYINGEKVSDEYLTPAFNGYDSWIQVQTYDLSACLKEGENTITALTGDGLYKGRFGFDGGKSKIYGDRQAFICDLVMDYDDEERQLVSTDYSWSVKKSKLVFSDIYDGEVWDESFNEEKIYTTKVIKEGKEKLMPRLSLPIVVKEKIKPQKLIKSPKGEMILDMGQNMVGWISFVCRESYGVEIKLEHGEILQDGNFYKENLRYAKQEFVYISDGKARELRPKFTFYGFRYVKLSGFTSEIDINDFTGEVVYSDMEQTAFVETSNPKINRLFLNALWGQKGNFLDLPTDCPQRDERMGWTGDAQVFCGTASFNMDIYAFMKKYCYDMKLEQRKANGRTPMVVPSIGMDGGGSSAWADAATIIPWTMYKFYGDVGILEESYEGMKSWLEYIIKQDKEAGDRGLWTSGFHFGDWLAMDGTNPNFPTGGTKISYISSCYYLISCEIVAKAASILAFNEDKESYEDRAKKIRKEIRKEFFTEQGKLSMDNQTAFALALYCKLLDEDKLVDLAKDFNAKMEEDAGYLKTGFVGTPILCRMLSDFGYNDMAYKLFLNEEMPSWLYCVNLGATTIWERWNSVLEDGSMNPEGMNSLNHYAYGSVMEWFYRNVAGINQIEPAFKTFKIKPMANKRLDWTKTTFNSPIGKIESNWEITKDGITYFISIPFNSFAYIELPFEKEKEIWVNGKKLVEDDYEIRGNHILLGRHKGNYEIKVLG